MDTIGFIGAGSFSTSLSCQLAQKGQTILLWDKATSLLEAIEKTRENPALPGVKLPSNVKPCFSLEQLLQKCSYVIIATTSEQFQPIVELIDWNKGQSVKGIAVMTKGFLNPLESQGQFLFLDFLQKQKGLERMPLAYISGPSHAQEIKKSVVTGLVISSSDLATRTAFCDIFSRSIFLPVPSEDIVGTQLCASLKNIVAMAFGMLDALEQHSSQSLGDNTKAIILTQGLQEICLVGKALGATTEQTFYSFAGLGDLYLTCQSQHGRNRRFGYDVVYKNLLDSYENFEQIIHSDKMEYLAEGVFALYHLYYHIFPDQTLTHLNLKIFPALLSLFQKKANVEQIFNQFFASFSIQI